MLRRLRVGLTAVLVLNATAASLLRPAFTLQSEYFCALEEHVHTADCYERRLICALEEDEGHRHEDACFEQELILLCDLEADEGHVHDESCYLQQLRQLCGLEEGEGHSHDESCYETTRELICPLEQDESHSHSEDCYRELQTLICLLPEREAHEHGEECFAGEEILICREPERPPHSHGENCYAMREIPICGQEEREGHIHSAACFQTELTCTKEEHSHSLACRANPQADLEDESDWTMSFPSFAEDAPRLRRLLAIARSQLGYSESAANFILDENGCIHGYTRYGVWYGLPYGDWCAMFVSFCLYYAGIGPGVVPYACAADDWIARLTDCGLYCDRMGSGYAPRPGDMVFFAADGGTRADHVGLVYAVDTENGGFVSIEGNLNDSVTQGEYGLDDPRIVGYGLLPEALRAEEEIYAQREMLQIAAESAEAIDPDTDDAPDVPEAEIALSQPPDETEPAERVMPEVTADIAETADDDYSASDEAPAPMLKIITLDADDPEIRLTGAVFTLEIEDGGVWKAQGTYPVDENGCCVVEELVPGRYRLIETKAPEGYIILHATVAFTLDERGSVDVEQTALAHWTEGVLRIGNRVGAALPETGGVGTAYFHVGGMLLLLGAAGLASGSQWYRGRKTHPRRGRKASVNPIPKEGSMSS